MYIAGIREIGLRMLRRSRPDFYVIPLAPYSCIPRPPTLMPQPIAIKWCDAEDWYSRLNRSVPCSDKALRTEPRREAFCWKLKRPQPESRRAPFKSVLE
jgi:hypothetical protein